MSEYANKQVMDIKTSKGIADSSNKQLRKWTERGWDQAMKEGNSMMKKEATSWTMSSGTRLKYMMKKGNY